MSNWDLPKQNDDRLHKITSSLRSSTMDQELRNLYDRIYSVEEDYNRLIDDKYSWVRQFLQRHQAERVVDLGCGPGNYVRKLTEEGFVVLGVEPSNVCCQKHLQDVPHLNASIEEFGKDRQHFDAVVCMDVLEHLRPEELDKNLLIIKNTAPVAILGIANSKSIHEKRDIHLIRKPMDWWEKKLSRYFETVKLLGTWSEKRFFVYECINRV